MLCKLKYIKAILICNFKCNCLLYTGVLAKSLERPGFNYAKHIFSMSHCIYLYIITEAQNDVKAGNIL